MATVGIFLRGRTVIQGRLRLRVAMQLGMSMAFTDIETGETGIILPSGRILYELGTTKAKPKGKKPS